MGLKRLSIGLLTVLLVAIGHRQRVVVANDFVSDDQVAFFEREVRPLLIDQCYCCHSADSESPQAGLLVDSRDSLLRGGDSGPAIVPGDAEASLLMQAVHYQEYEMPPSGKLPPQSIASLRRWIQAGAAWPIEDPPTSRSGRPKFDLLQRKSQHWAWQPIVATTPPEVADQSWARSPIDHFILAKLEDAGLHPSDDVDRPALLRRLSFDLIGLPPTIEQVRRYCNDDAVDATTRLVDELLASPHFGERWGRHWLDLVRYAESRGHEFDEDSPNAYQYRDYVIRALNADVPYDQFVREHLAGDRLDHPRTNPIDHFDESILGTGFWFLGEWVHSPVDIRKDEADRFDNMIDVMSKTFLGVTVSCARCHDHKFDAISTADYYSLSGFLQSSQFRQVRFDSIWHNRDIAIELSRIDHLYRGKIDSAIAAAGVRPPKSVPRPSDTEGVVVVDFGSIDHDQFFQDGFLFGDFPRQFGQAFLTTVNRQTELRFAARTAAVSDSFWAGLRSTREEPVQRRSKLAELPRSGRTLRTPTFELVDGDVRCRVNGEGHVVACVDSHRFISGPLHRQTIQSIAADVDWVTIDLDRYVGHRVHLEFTPAEGSQLEVEFVAVGGSDRWCDEVLDQQRRNAAAIEEFRQRVEYASSDDADLKLRLANLLSSWTDDRDRLRSRIKHDSRLAMAMMDGSGEDQPIFIRGNASKPGKIEPRHFLTAISGDDPMPIVSGSGRLELADAINNESNPLTSRVIVNRIWHHLMGRGIVSTTDDFGVLGATPSHPDLLDFLATQFVADGQSLKQMIRAIVLSRSYQMSTHADAKAIDTDPTNRLWHHRPPGRLEGEVIRDALLSASGQLDRTFYGESIDVHLTEFMDGRGRPKRSGPIDGGRRRTIYNAVRRNFLSPFMQSFDSPSPSSTMGRRNVSNVPAQALILMNDPFVTQQSTRWAVRALERSLDLRGRIDWLYQIAFARYPTDKEQRLILQYIERETERRGVDHNDERLWADVTHALINSKEFIFLR